MKQGIHLKLKLGKNNLLNVAELKVIYGGTYTGKGSPKEGKTSAPVTPPPPPPPVDESSTKQELKENP